MRDIRVPPELFGPWRAVGDHVPRDERAFPDELPAACRCGWESETQDWLTHATRVRSELERWRAGRGASRGEPSARPRYPRAPAGLAWAPVA